MFENRMLKNIFGPKRDEVTGKCSRQHNEELYDLCFSLNIIRVIKIKKNEMGGVCGTYVEQKCI